MQGEIHTVADVPEDYTLLQNSQSVMHVLDHIDVDAEDYRHGHMFVRTHQGEYTDVLWFSGVVAYLHKSVTRLL